MKTIRVSPVLRSKAKTGKTKCWELRLLTDGKGFFLERTWWQEGDTHQSSTPEQVRGKNAGKSNATTDQQQASVEFDAAVKKRRDKGYSEDGTSGHVYTKPMLAHVFADRASSIKYPVYAQPKLDGFRMLMDGDNAWTRGGKDHVRECVQHLMFDCNDLTLDGELLLPGNQKLQITASAAKKYNRGVSETLEYWVYDIVDPRLSFAERWELLQALFEKPHPKNVKLVPTVMLDSEADIMTAHGVFVSVGGYEGSIIRAASSKYEIGFRSYGLLKLKDFQDGEFQVVGVEHGKGSFEDKPILVLEAKPGVTFNAVPEGNDEYRRALWRDRDELLGQWWTIRYQTLSKEGKPVFPVAVGPRKEGE